MSTNKVTSHSAAKSRVAGHLANVRHFHTLPQGDNTSFIQRLEVECWVATLYKLAHGNAKAGFGWNTDEVAECPHTMGPTLGTKFVCHRFTSPFTGRWLEHWAHNKCRLKTLQWQLGSVKVMFIGQWV